MVLAKLMKFNPPLHFSPSPVATILHLLSALPPLSHATLFAVCCLFSPVRLATHWCAQALRAACPGSIIVACFLCLCICQLLITLPCNTCQLHCAGSHARWQDSHHARQQADLVLSRPWCMGTYHGELQGFRANSCASLAADDSSSPILCLPSSSTAPRALSSTFMTLTH
jgi:hypothetical protein